MGGPSQGAESGIGDPFVGEGQEIRVLHVDDDGDFRDLTAEYLEREVSELSVRSVESAQERLSLLETTTIHCIVSDYSMPEMDGLAFLSAVRESYPRLPFVLFTGRGSEAIASEAISAGVTDYIQKEAGTHQFEVLAHRITNAVESYTHSQKIERSEARLRKIIDLIPQHVYVKDVDGVYHLVNETVVESYGTPREEIEGAPASRFLPDEDAQRYARDDKEVLESGEPKLIPEDPYTDPEGKTHVLETTKIPFEFADTDRPAILGISRDVTDEKRLERRFKTLHAVAKDLDSCETPSAVYEVLVDAAEDVLEYDLAIADAAEGGVLVPMAISTAVGDEAYYEETPIDAEDNLAAQVYRTGESSLVEDLVPEGIDPADERYRSALTVPIGDHGIFQTVSSEVGGFTEDDLELVETLVSHGQTTLTRLEREESLRKRRNELERQNARLEEFASIVSHDLRTPLNVAQGRAEFAQEECDSEDLDKVVESLSQMATIIEDTLTLAREGSTIRDPEPIEIRTLARENWAMVEADGARLEVEEDFVLVGDSDRLSRAFGNLFENAVRYAGPDLTVRIGRTEDGFYVEDDGEGIPESACNAVFEAGYTSSSEGTGFGLAIVKRIAEAHGWSVRVTEGSDGGARFEFGDVDVR